MAMTTSRRNFLRTAPVAAAAGVILTEQMLWAPAAVAQAVAAGAVPFAFFTAAALADDAKALAGKGGNKTLVNQAPGMPCQVVMTTEIGKAAKEFEWHDGRDHIVQVIEGTTVYEMGGTPKNARNTRPGEYLAPESEGATKLTLTKGDMLTIPRGTPHKRSTEGSVTFLLFSPFGAMKG